MSAPGPTDALGVLTRLQREQSHTTQFLFQPPGTRGAAFLGCTPERLFRRSGRLLDAEAVAGTRARGRDAAQDEALGRDLLASAKERHEHALVVSHVREALAGCCEAVQEQPGPRLMRLRHVQHLATGFSGTLRPGVGEGALLAGLHPTPAVCGRPVGKARAFIRDHESFHRGWYAGPVGWMSSQGSELVVAIRSALVRERSLYSYAGAGIVTGSEPEAEWREIDRKNLPFAQLGGRA